jgi:hypothetical protein
MLIIPIISSMLQIRLRLLRILQVSAFQKYVVPRIFNKHSKNSPLMQQYTTTPKTQPRMATQ